MPIYEYDCYDCGSRTETLRSSKDLNNSFQCPDCQSWTTKRAVSAASVLVPFDGTFKGSGRSDLDKVIGQSAETRREQYQSEQKKRNEVRVASGQRAIGKDRDGNYVPVPNTYLNKRQEAFDKFDYAKKTGVKIER